MKHLFFIYIFSGIVFIPFSLLGKRHSRITKADRYEKRALQAAELNTPLEKALHKQTKSMTFDEALIAQEYYRSTQEQDMIIKCGERLLSIGGEQDALRLTRLELAELFLTKNKYAEAEKHAQDYLLYYPGAKESKRASFVALQACYKSQSNSFKDQQKTRTTISLADEYLEKYPQDTEYTQHVKEIRNQSYLKLIRSELNVIDSQLSLFNNAGSKNSLPSAQKRLKNLKEKYLPHAPNALKRVEETEQNLEKVAGAQQTLTLAYADSRTRFEKVTDFFREDNPRYFA